MKWSRSLIRYPWLRMESDLTPSESGSALRCPRAGFYRSQVWGCWGNRSPSAQRYGTTTFKVKLEIGGVWNNWQQLPPQRSSTTKKCIFSQRDQFQNIWTFSYVSLKHSVREFVAQCWPWVTPQAASKHPAERQPAIKIRLTLESPSHRFDCHRQLHESKQGNSPLPAFVWYECADNECCCWKATVHPECPEGLARHIGPVHFAEMWDREPWPVFHSGIFSSPQPVWISSSFQSFSFWPLLHFACSEDPVGSFMIWLEKALWHVSGCDLSLEPEK